MSLRLPLKNFYEDIFGRTFLEPNDNITIPVAYLAARWFCYFC